MMHRSNSFVNSLKWWPLQGHNNQQQQQQQQNNSSSPQAASSAPTTPTSIWPLGQSATATTTSSTTTIPHHNHHNKTVTFGSSVAVQKLRESKWFKANEQRIFCAVVECGFIVEVRNSAAVEAAAAAAAAAAASATSDVDSLDMENINNLTSVMSNTVAGSGGSASSAAAVTGGGGAAAISLPRNTSSSISFMEDQDENETPVTSWYGIVLCKTAKDNKPKPETIEIFSVKIRENGTYKMIKMALADIWKNGWELRINNFSDKEKVPHNEKDIRNQVSLARKAKQSLWNNSKHFAYWCRYGSRQQDVRRRQMSECVRWGSAGTNAGMLLVLKRMHCAESSYIK